MFFSFCFSFLFFCNDLEESSVRAVYRLELLLENLPESTSSIFSKKVIVIKMHREGVFFLGLKMFRKMTFMACFSMTNASILMEEDFELIECAYKFKCSWDKVFNDIGAEI